MSIKMNVVKSTSINQIGYFRRTLCVKFNSGRSYEFKKVPRVTFDSFLQAASKGEFFNKKIKGNYTQVEI